MSGYRCQYCGKISGTTTDDKTRKERPAMSENGCSASASKWHKWVKK